MHVIILYELFDGILRRHAFNSNAINDSCMILFNNAHQNGIQINLIVFIITSITCKEQHDGRSGEITIY